MFHFQFGTFLASSRQRKSVCVCVWKTVERRNLEVKDLDGKMCCCSCR
jgi:hypothetical protein